MRAWTAALAALALALAACGGTDEADGPPTDPGPEQGAAGELSGLLRITAGQCADAGVTSGSWFRMVQSGGTVDEGPYVANGDSPCGDQTWLPLLPGSDGGLVIGDHQPFPEPAFDEQGNALADRVTRPAPWFAVNFSLATNPVDPQTGTATDPPQVSHDGEGGVTGDVRAISAAWNGQYFNQGSPKPDGSLPDASQPVTGTYDPATGALVLVWASQIVGGAFDNFTGVWRLEGTLEPAG